jgi:4a-hydroxytetrahydrobiopterin dehydratase
MSAKAAKTAKKAKSEKPAKAAATPLHEAHCKPIKGADHKLGAADVKALLKGLHGWKLIDKGEAIEKMYTFKNYYRTLAFVNALAFIAHREDHHPDLGVHYGKVVVRYATHDVSGLSMNDFICAAKVEQLAADAA